MYKRRLIPVLFLKDGWMVRSEAYAYHQYIGDPVSHVERMMQWDVDELIVLDISIGEIGFDHHRTDYRNKPVSTLLEFIAMIAVECRIPLTFGGRIRTIDDIHARIQNGADKVSINAMLNDAPESVVLAVRRFGSQAIVASIDYRVLNGQPRAFLNHARIDSGVGVVEWARRAEQLGVGEILLNAVDRDGTAMGYDIETATRVADAVALPVIACGGAGQNCHFADLLQKTQISAAAAGNIFHFKENAYPLAKKYLKKIFSDIR